MNLAEFQESHIPLIEQGLKAFFNARDFGTSGTLKEMLTYHMGWQDQGGHGKRLRPLITLLCTEALGGQAQDAMPAALAVEFLHNFTLIHDDIEDRSSMRHNRETLWMRWGEAQAINAGDALFSIAQLAMLDLAHATNPEAAVKAGQYFNQTCLHLTQGQHLDLAFEKARDITIASYLEMIGGKTGALIAFSAAVGAIVAQKTLHEQDLLGTFGSNLGLAFQVQDDILGIWGNPEVTGKSAASDLLARKKTLPVLFGLEHSAEFQKLWSENVIKPHKVEHMSALLQSCGAKAFTSQMAQEYTGEAFKALETLFSVSTAENSPVQALFELCEVLLGRNY